MEKVSLGIETASSILNVSATFVRGADNVVNVIELFVPLVNNITKAVHEIQVLCETIEYNKRMCGTFLERALLAEAATKALITRADYYEEKLRSTEFYKGFQKFTEVIEKIKKFVKEVSQSSALRTFILASDIKSRFTALLEEFDGLINILQFSMVVRSSDINYTIHKDLEELKRYMERIEGGITKRGANEILINPNLEDIAIMNVAWQNGTFPINEKSVMISTNLITDHPAGRKYKEIEQALYNNPATGIEPRLKDCKHIIEFYGLVENDMGTYLITQWADNGHLKNFYTENHAMAHWSLKTKISVDIARALTFLHSVSIYHHDLRSENVLITDRYTAKLANFTKSRCFSAESNPMKRTLEKVRYMAPEKVNDKQRYNLKCEIFSFGRLLWEIAECKAPFSECQDISELKELVCDPKTTLCFSSRVPKEWQGITNKAMRYKANLRPALSEIFSILFDVAEKYGTDTLPCQSYLVQTCGNGNDLTSDLEEASLDNFADLDITDSYANLHSVMSVQDALIEHKNQNGNKKAAFEAFRIHAEYGNNIAKYWYGYYLDKEDKVPSSNESPEEKKQRHQKAAALFKETADEGLTDGQLRYGYYLWHGTGVTKNIPEAIKYFKMSAEGGNTTGMYTLGNVYYKGLGVDKDREKGAKYLRRASLLNQDKALKMCKKENISLA